MLGSSRDSASQNLDKRRCTSASARGVSQSGRNRCGRAELHSMASPTMPSRSSPSSTTDARGRRPAVPTTPRSKIVRKRAGSIAIISDLSWANASKISIDPALLRTILGLCPAPPNITQRKAAPRHRPDPNQRSGAGHAGGRQAPVADRPGTACNHGSMALDQRGRAASSRSGAVVARPSRSVLIGGAAPRRNAHIACRAAPRQIA